jgi:hypothetical protein
LLDDQNILKKWFDVSSVPWEQSSASDAHSEVSSIDSDNTAKDKDCLLL